MSAYSIDKRTTNSSLVKQVKRIIGFVCRWKFLGVNIDLYGAIELVGFDVNMCEEVDGPCTDDTLLRRTVLWSPILQL